ncbi:MAG: carbamoyl phosphate synthase large subunit [Candidatus Kerfeldbacteria bacterium CG15_BIG_FIL_POST_REV_8_21_14_020_45_12]|uniref:Carbamoyl phosphate synthase large subunit n=1 Tax=Candidatus Kerfeldbacteria bacterium CG15_BIG_FIL_POST_REV_8_21_14_020_45_12 TaxID=2014247 RepID=A0A2M7H4M5_9BACT|nr:MAG: carbamoyl phosphate synthase large subunit [Candidatus Kerfeldbacteria bacterium CG15_BIG_FIL_POST_REV_8_21_14_020_45_12]PJA93656.1 MAG: carbamoyl phosphate synthase large subunit [Candidatus Kerfeldbacteria bacterium CG_4_9_14_3_um_filter_45_8]
MSHISKPKKVLILGSGGLRIGQAGEFDYSGSQAIKALQEEGIESVLINPNIATVQTNEDMASRVYFLPITKEFAEQVIERERPDAIFLSFGGQTALNVGLELEEAGILKKYGVAVLGTPTQAIRKTEDRDLFAKALGEIDVSVAESYAVNTVAQAKSAAKKLGYPLMVRSAYSLGGKGSGRIKNESELVTKLTEAFTSVPQVLVEKYLGGWKEVEYEVVRDQADNCVTVCNMENFDPMGIHTGESIVVAPSQTLTNDEYHSLRTVAMKAVRHIGIIGECNIQYALNPKNGEYRVIEINARLSRSSALASKATGYPLAWVAAKLALGYKLTEIQNLVTKKTQACFEPAMDYVAVKMPRWDLLKFKAASRRIGSEMKSVGEVMAIGRTFEEALQKAARMVNVGADGVVGNDFRFDDLMDEIKNPTDRRLFALAAAMKQGESVDSLHQKTSIDRWFLGKLKRMTDMEKALKIADKLDQHLLRQAKQLGFSDIQIAKTHKSTENKIRVQRKKYGILPVIKQIDTLAGEFPAQTNYLYLTYNGTENDVVPGEKSLAVIGSGSYRIGSSVEFDWCCVQASATAKQMGYQTIMINCNPETVSTDFDTCDRLYFEELSLERVLDIYDYEQPKGIIVSMGGQTPNNLALPLKQNGCNIVGTDPSDIDRAEDRHKFSSLLDELGINQPAWRELTTTAQAKTFAKKVGYPVLIRPSYVLSGAAMNIAFTEEALTEYLAEAAQVSKDHPVVISKFIENAREIEIDGVAQDGKLIIYAFTEHIENAGVHSGDATVVTPPQKTYLETIRRAKHITRDVLRELNITGPFNIQFLARHNSLRVIELNLRASRSFPFVSKVTKYNFIDIATRAILGEDMQREYNTLDLDYVGVKAPQFSYSRIKGADPVLYVEMGSTGEVACFGDNYREAFLKSLLAADLRLPGKNIALSIGNDNNKHAMSYEIGLLHAMGHKLYATEHTADFIQSLGIPVTRIYKISDTRQPSIEKLIQNETINFIINIPRKYNRKTVSDGFRIRRMAIDHNVSLISNLQVAKTFIRAIHDLHVGRYTLEPKAWDEYHHEQ